MKKLILLLIIFPHSFLFAQRTENKLDFFELADAFFKKYVVAGKVDYLALYAYPEDFSTLLRKMETEDLKDKTAEYQKAFWLNAYNIVVIKSIVAKGGMQSPKDERGFFSAAKHKVAGVLLTLDEIEHKMLLDSFGDERMHFALVCGAEGCPSLAGFSYHPDSVEQQILSQTKQVFNDGKFIRVSNSKKTVELSKIFDWYKKDFAQSGMNIITYINQYRTVKIPADYKVTYYEYDWNLNIKRN